jgi:hypothetical protein
MDAHRGIARMTRIVTTTYRYRRTPRKRKAVAIETLAVVTTKSSRRLNLEEKAAAEVPHAPVSREEGAAAQLSTPIVTTKSGPPLRSLGKGKDGGAEVLVPPTTGQRAQSSTPPEVK